MTIEYFDMYVRTDDGFIATKGDKIIQCYWTAGMDYGVAIYKDRQKSNRCLAYAGGGSVEWCRKAVIKQLQRLD